MVATLPHNRIGFDSPPKVKPELPKTARERGQLWSDAVFEAVMTLKNQLSSNSEAIAAAAANSILDLERTRIRHDKTVAGSCLPEHDTPANRLPGLEPLPDLEPLGNLERLQDDGMEELDDELDDDELDDEPMTEDECLNFHTAELLTAIPEHNGKKLTNDEGEKVTREFLKAMGARPSDIEPGRFMVHLSRHLRRKEAAKAAEETEVAEKQPTSGSPVSAK